jgi:hypothetical protein
VAGVWSDFATIAGSASGALTGLLFVAVSLNRDRVAKHPALRSQAGQTLVLFLLPLIISVVLVVPGTPRWVLGLELVTIAVVSGAATGCTGWPRRSSSRWSTEWSTPGCS